MCSINLVVGVCTWQKGQITWIADLWLVVGHAIILIDLAAPLIYVTIMCIKYCCLRGRINFATARLRPLECRP